MTFLSSPCSGSKSTVVFSNLLFFLQSFSIFDAKQLAPLHNVGYFIINVVGEMDKKLSVVRVGKSVVNITAAWKGNRLHVASVKSHKLSDKRASDALRLDGDSKRRKGYLLAVDEHFQFFAVGVLPTRLSDIDLNGRPKLVNALNAYYHLTASQSISFANGVKKLSISESIVDKEIVDGKEKYLIDWDSAKDVDMAFLLVCYVAVFNQNSEVNYMRSVMNSVKRMKGRRKAAPRGFRT